MTTAIVPQLSVIDGRPVTSSLNVADVFGKQHKDVLRAIGRVQNDATLIEEEFSRRNFAPSTYVDDRGKPQPMFNITRDGFTLLAMGFTGREAMKFKLAYIAAFNRMESELMELAAGSGRRTDIHHHRGPVSVSGLDIRYTLDLTKIVTRPTRASLALFTRLSGIDVSDILPEPTSDAGLVDRFAADCLVLVADAGPTSRITLADAYRRYQLWHEATNGERGLHSLKWLSARLRDIGLTVQLAGGRTWVYGVRLTEEVAA